MPWDIKRHGSTYDVVQRNNGRVVGSHKTREEAVSQQAALYASENNKEKSDQSKKRTWNGMFFPTTRGPG